MKPWAQRPLEIANLLNPAFCGLILHEFCSQYEAESQHNTPYAVTFVALPIVLSRRTRETMKPQTRQLQNWLADNEAVKVDLARRIRDLVPFTREALLFLAQRALLRFTHNGDLEIASSIPRIRSAQFLVGERKEIVGATATLARWIARAGNADATYAQLGVQP